MRIVGFIALVLWLPLLRAETLEVSSKAQPFGLLSNDHSVQWALAQIESGHLKRPDTARGNSGEVSRYQILPKTWRLYSHSRNYSDPVIAWTVARKILCDRQEWFTRLAGRAPTAFDLYVIWNKPSVYQRIGFEPHRLPSRIRDVARRFSNLVESAEQQLVSAPKLRAAALAQE